MKKIILGIIFLVITSCTSLPKVYTDYDQNYNRSNYKTYKIEQPEIDASPSQLSLNPILLQRIERAIHTSLEKLISEIERLVLCKPEKSFSQRPPIEVPVCYGGEYGSDLSNVAEHLGCSVPEIVDRHTKPIYLVYMVGFLPGFAYMGSADTKIDIPRHQTPRVRVPAGSVGLAGEQTGIYPMEMPGGWQLIGRTSLKPFDLSQADPFLFKPGDCIRFVSVTSDRYRDGCISSS